MKNRVEIEFKLTLPNKTVMDQLVKDFSAPLNNLPGNIQHTTAKTMATQQPSAPGKTHAEDIKKSRSSIARGRL
ncbi:hypothetical protein [Rickettsiales endosymbiont of Stachyamoeba lipophora]|uniref:hypothetical protein n=1 Tax=Rickettsiales endosymbiont of Stachyamoeba lipophora TaxID=2486578 RepID=UPI000F65213E|nr:hypothetical protein [Rickettsiales endosymbiont of Stachyamoeba lipophora]AZL15928.1 hypothetical protein EF513_05155 [Rickettsiales endosymbiont of Stachyamoeba lipophora]